MNDDGVSNCGRGEHRSKVLSSEQQRKFQELRERRLQLQKAEAVESGKKKKKGKSRTLSPAEQAATHNTSEEARQGFGKQQRRRVVADSAELADQSAAMADVHERDADNPRAEGSTSPDLSTATTLVPLAAVEETEVPMRKKRKKLHWGLETKERWERKGNM